MCTLEHLKYRLGYSSRKDFLKLSGSINAESLCRQAFVLILLMMNVARVIFYMRFQPKEEAIGAKAIAIGAIGIRERGHRVCSDIRDQGFVPPLGDEGLYSNCPGL
jgi:hypothetical protein